MTVQYNACSLGPQSAEEAKKLNWHRMDCLAVYKLKNERDTSKIRAWFKTQNKEWQTDRSARFNSRLVGR
jgi:hypothetical protein